MSTGSDRDKAKGAVLEKEESDPELADALRGAQSLQLALTKETHRHTEAMRRADLGWFGRGLGGEATAPTVIASFAVAFGLLATVGCYVVAAQSPDLAEFWSSQAERLLGFAGAALGFIFGRGLKSH